MRNVFADKKAISVFVIPGLAIYLGIVIVPLIWSMYYSLFEGIPGQQFVFIGFDNYLRMFSDPYFLNSLIVTFRYVAIVGTGQVFFGAIAALLIHYGTRGRSALARTLIFVPVGLPVVSVGQLWTKIYDIVPQYGLLNSLLDILSLDNLIKEWIGLSSTALYALTAQDIWKGMGFYAIIFFAGLVDIPEDILEAARIDGADRLNTLRRIILPLLKPVTATCLILSLSGTLKVFASAKALTRGGPGRATQMQAMYMYDSAFTNLQYGYGSAIAIFILIEALILTMVVRRIFRTKPEDVR
ncbi:MAG TPA: sugar ABC transporter permease [Clostridiales bacterium]|nr:sugar ABC transporter permease [Clostridiales bacterium]